MASPGLENGWGFEQSVWNQLCCLGADQVRLLLAISGGADSTALLRACAELSSDRVEQLQVVHINHKLRGDQSELDERFVAELSAGLGIQFHCVRVDVRSLAATEGQGLEAAARQLRYQGFAEVAAECGVDHLVTAHTLDDQVETVLHRILRGTGLSGIAGIAGLSQRGRLKLVRPMLHLGRSDVEAYLRRINQAHRCDQSNADLSFSRNRIRGELMPYLRDAFNRRVPEAIERLRRQAEAACEILAEQVNELEQSAALYASDAVTFSSAVLAEQRRFLVAELLRRAWRKLHWPEREMGEAQWEKAVQVVIGELTGWDFPGGIQGRYRRKQAKFDKASLNENRDS